MQEPTQQYLDDDAIAFSDQATTTADIDDLLTTALWQVGWFTVACSRGVEHSVYTERAEQEEALTPAQLATRRRGALFPNALVEMAALSCGSCTLQLVDLPQNWSGAPGAQSLHSDLVVVAAIVCICVKLHLALREEGPRTLLDLLDTLGKLTRKAPKAVPAIHDFQIVKQEAFFLLRASSTGSRSALQGGVEPSQTWSDWPVAWEQCTSRLY